MALLLQLYEDDTMVHGGGSGSVAMLVTGSIIILLPVS